ncbi:hypothetical protein [Streptomyces sp. NPDC093707]|uniref:hypothetical protein n=1 Tax=Streptomyces sp. NPDC093707 TaxID=3154984 RepID=UPI00344E59A8
MWKIRTVTNKSSNPLWLAYCVGPNTRTDSLDLCAAPDGVDIGSHDGAIYLRSTKASSEGESQSVEITGALGATVWGHSDPGILDVTVEEDDSVTLTDNDGAVIASGTFLMPTGPGYASMDALGNCDGDDGLCPRPAMPDHALCGEHLGWERCPKCTVRRIEPGRARCEQCEAVAASAAAFEALLAARLDS